MMAYIYTYMNDRPSVFQFFRFLPKSCLFLHFNKRDLKYFEKVCHFLGKSIKK